MRNSLGKFQLRWTWSLAMFFVSYGPGLVSVLVLVFIFVWSWSWSCSWSLFWSGFGLGLWQIPFCLSPESEFWWGLDSYLGLGLSLVMAFILVQFPTWSCSLSVLWSQSVIKSSGLVLSQRHFYIGHFGIDYFMGGCLENKGTKGMLLFLNQTFTEL